jgi:hypothetical protein
MVINLGERHIAKTDHGDSHVLRQVFCYQIALVFQTIAGIKTVAEDTGQIIKAVGEMKESIGAYGFFLAIIHFAPPVNSHKGYY